MTHDVEIRTVQYLSGHVSYHVWVDGTKVGTRRTWQQAEQLADRYRPTVFLDWWWA